MDNTFNQAFKPITNTKSIKEYESEIDAQNNVIFELKSKLLQVSNNTGQSAPMYEINDVLCNSRTAIKLLEEENAKLKFNLESMKMPLKERSNMENENKRLNEKMKKVIADFQYKQDELLNDNNLLRTELLNYKDNIASQQYNEKIACIESERDTLIEEAERKKVEFENIVSNFQRKINEQENIYKRSINELRSENEDMKKQVASYQMNHNEQKTQLLQFEDKYNQLWHKYEENNINLTNEIKNVINQRDAEKKNYEEKISSLCNQLNCLVIDKKNLENSKSHIEKEIEDIKRGMMIYHRDAEQNNANMDYKNTEIEEKNKRITDLEKMINTLEANNNKILKDYMSNTEVMKNENKNLNMKMVNLENEIGAFRKKAEIYSKQRNDISKKYEKIKEEYVNDKENKSNGIYTLHEKNNELEQKYMYLKEKIKEKDDFINLNLNETKKSVQEINATIKQYKDNLYYLKTKITSIQDKLDKSEQQHQRTDQKLKLNEILNHENLKFVQSNFPHESNINSVIPKIARIFTKMTDKINVLENDAKQLSMFAGKNVKEKNKQTEKLIDDFIVDFKNAKCELEFCKNYLKEKSRALKDLKNERQTFQNKIKELEQQIENVNAIKEKKPSFFSRLY